MMGEDKLTHRQRIRLEAFSQAIASTYVVSLLPPEQADVVRIAPASPPTMEALISRAEMIEAWLLRADQ